MFDYKRWIADNRANELFLRNLFEVGESEFGKEFLMGRQMK